MRTQLEIDAERFSEFLVENTDAEQWEDPVSWAAWYISHAYIATVVDDGKIVALCAMRPVDRPGFGVLPYYHNERGRSLHIDVLIDKTDDTRAIMLFRKLFTLRFGPRETVAMFRRTEESIHVYDWLRFWKRLARVKRINKKENKNAGTKQQSTVSA